MRWVWGFQGWSRPRQDFSKRMVVGDSELYLSGTLTGSTRRDVPHNKRPSRDNNARPPPRRERRQGNSQERREQQKGLVYLVSRWDCSATRWEVSESGSFEGQRWLGSFRAATCVLATASGCQCSFAEHAKQASSKQLKICSSELYLKQLDV